MRNYQNALQSTQVEKDRADQVQNNAGGFVFQVSPETQLTRFLILGVKPEGSYCQTSRTLTRENAKVAIDALNKDPEMVLRVLRDVSLNGRARRQDETLFVLALAASHGKLGVRRAALALLPEIARTGTHLFMFLTYVTSMRGWGRALKQAVARWYDSKPAEKAAFQMLKYRQREGWSHRDVLRLAHPTAHSGLYHYITKGVVGQLPVPSTVENFIAAQAETDPKKLAAMITKERLPREFIPTHLENDPTVSEALLYQSPPGALLRNLSRFSKNGVIAPVGGDAAKHVRDTLTNADTLRKARLHPLQILEAQKAYASGTSVHGHGSWTPNQSIVDALEDAFYASFGFIEPTGKPTLLGVDVSGSMWFGHATGALSNAAKAAVMAMVTARTEQDYMIMGFTSGFVDLQITAKDSLQDVDSKMRVRGFDGTDCAKPMLYAQQNKLQVDNFAVYTDNETWAGNVHPYKALQGYRKSSGRDARLAVVAFEPTLFTIVDPSDAGMMDFSGFDSAGPALMSQFFQGKL